jgi:hypothetical protein
MLKHWLVPVAASNTLTCVAGRLDIIQKRTPPMTARCPQSDGEFHFSELRSVESTAAPNVRCLVQSGDVPEATCGVDSLATYAGSSQRRCTRLWIRELKEPQHRAAEVDGDFKIRLPPLGHMRRFEVCLRHRFESASVGDRLAICQLDRQTQNYNRGPFWRSELRSFARP